MIAYAADSSSMFGALKQLPAADHKPGTMLEIYDWDSGKYLGKIPQAQHTFNVIGNMNEHQLAIGETTFGGLASLASQKGAILDYGSLIYVTLQRARTAQEAITTIVELTSKYGWASSGETFSIADPKEVWQMDIIGKGDNETGIAWVAFKLPEGHVSAHANHARISTFPRDDPDNWRFDPEIVEFARRKGLYNGTDEGFSFTDTFDKLTPLMSRITEARVWSFYRTVADDMEQYLDYARGSNLSHVMPLTVPAKSKVSLNDTFWHMRTHNEKSWFDNTNDEGAGAFHAPYRWRPLTWSDGDGHTYLNERTIATQQTAFHFVAQTLKTPAELGGLIWWSVDDAATSIHIPLFSSITRIPSSWGMPEGDKTLNGDLTRFSFDHAFWVFNMIANLAYPRWNAVYPDVASAIATAERELISAASDVVHKAEDELKAHGPRAAVEILTDFSVSVGDRTVRDALGLWQRLFVKYRDGQVTTVDKTNPACGCDVNENGYDKEWYTRIVKDTGDHYEVPGQQEVDWDAEERQERPLVDKLQFI